MAPRNCPATPGYCVVGIKCRKPFRPKTTKIKPNRTREMMPMYFIYLPPFLHLRKMRDRKSTRLNSSHLVISYAVFCLKKKKIQEHHLHSRSHLSTTRRCRS